ncbi:MAG: MFS transporter [Chitinophagaceae bacterium]|nr:MFS transporter [Chitinophagaceae bacterium]
MISAPKKVISAWCMYDWANSAYNLVITSTIFPAYYEAVTKNRQPNNEVTFLGRNFINTALYNYSLGVAFIIVAFISPILTSIADTRGNKKNFMRFFCTIGSIACAGLYFFTPTALPGKETALSQASLHFGILCMVISCIGYWGSLVFYNSYLPDLVEEQMRDRISARGFTLGYVGSVLLQIACFVIVFKPDWFGISGEFNKNYLPPRISFVLVGIWWLGFAQIPFKHLPKGNIKTPKEKNNVFKTGFQELKKVWEQVKHLPVLKRFLYSFFWYSAGIQTVFLAATQFGAKELHLPIDNLIFTIMIIQLLAIPGAIVISRASEKFGNIITLIFTTMIWVALCAAAYFITTATQFYILGAVVGLVMGGIQSVSRSTYANLMPETKDTASFFSFYDVTEKVALVIGMFSFAYMEELTGSMRNSVLALMIFFFLGVIFLIWTLASQKKVHARR